MAFAENGDPVIGIKSGTVYCLASSNTAPEGLIDLDDYPQSMAFRRGEIFIARTLNEGPRAKIVVERPPQSLAPCHAR